MTGNKKRGSVPALRRTASLSSKAHEQEDSSLFKQTLSGAAYGTVAFLTTGLALISATTAIAYTNTDPSGLIAPLGLVSLFLSAFAGGFVTAKKVSEAPLLCGIVCGGMITVLAAFFGIILRGIPSSGYEFWQSAALHGSAVAFAVLGAFAGNVKRKPTKLRKRFGR